MSTFEKYQAHLEKLRQTDLFLTFKKYITQVFCQKIDLDYIPEDELDPETKAEIAAVRKKFKENPDTFTDL